MKSWLSFLALSTALAFSSCATFDQTQLAQMRSCGVPPPLVDKLAHGRSITPPEVVVLTRHGVPEPTLISYIHDTGLNYVFTRSDARYLHHARVGDAVIDALASESGDFASDYAVAPRRYSVGVGYRGGSHRVYREPYGGWDGPNSPYYGWGGPYDNGWNGASGQYW